MKLANVRHRVVATIIDNLIILLSMTILLIFVWPGFLKVLINGEVFTLAMMIKLIRATIVYALFLLFYYIIIPNIYRGQTIGKKLLKIKIVTEQEKDVDYKDLFFREVICRILIRTVSFGISSVVSYFIMLIREDNKSLADIFAKTKVIDIKEEFKNGNSTQSR